MDRTLRKKSFRALLGKHTRLSTKLTRRFTKKCKTFYKKTIRSSKNYKSHDENNKFKVGDTVRIQECRPISKTKTWTVLED